MTTNTKNRDPKILVLATLSGGYRGADAVGQGHHEYPPNVYILPVMSAAIFPPSFYLDAFDRGIDGIIVMFSGSDSPYKGVPERTAELVNQTYEVMKERNINPRRLKLAAICTVCVHPFLREIEAMNDLLDKIGLIPESIPPVPEAQPLAA